MCLTIVISLSVVLITGGADQKSYQKSEIYNPVTKESCSLPQFPAPRGLHSQNGELCCGGGYSDPASANTCVKWNPASGTWKQSHTLRENRTAHVSWAASSGVYLLGGSSSAKRTSEKVNEDGSVEESFSLKYNTGYKSPFKLYTMIYTLSQLLLCHP